MAAKRGSLKAALKSDVETLTEPVIGQTLQKEPSSSNRGSNVAPSRQGKRAVMAHFDPAVIKQLKQIGLDSDKTVQAMITEALNDFFAKNDKPPIAS